MLSTNDGLLSLNYIPWFAWIAIFGIIAGVIITVVTKFAGRNTELSKALDQNSAVNEKLLARLDAIDSRLGSVEKTLTDIP
ncbi:MAG: hypothetical protein ABI238_05285 [Terrimesophilobacter sp.]